MSTCSRCGAQFGCAMADGLDAPCWCTRLPPLVPVPADGAGPQASGCWCSTCLEQHIAQRDPGAPATPRHRRVRKKRIISRLASGPLRSV